VTASVTRKVWTDHFCTAEVVYFTEDDIVAESRSEWYCGNWGSANIETSTVHV
jgi:hypothetical protein